MDGWLDGWRTGWLMDGAIYSCLDDRIDEWLVR